MNVLLWLLDAVFVSLLILVVISVILRFSHRVCYKSTSNYCSKCRKVNIPILINHVTTMDGWMDI